MSTQALRCQNLHKSFGRHEVLKGLNLSVEQGSIHGLVGLNGAGKTTTLECLLGLQRRNKGEISLLGTQPEKLYTTSGKVAVVFDSPCLHPNLSVRQCLDFARLSNPNSKPSSELESLLGIEKYSNFKTRHLSLGNQRRTSIAQALITKPEFIILDEPFNGLDASGVEDVLALISHLNQQEGTTFLLASHQLSYLEKVCSHMAILHEGTIPISQSLSSLLQSDKTTVEIYTQDIKHARIVLSQIKGITVLPTDSNNEFTKIVCQLNNLSSAELNRELVKLDVAIDQLILQRPSLESLFAATTNGVLNSATNPSTNPSKKDAA